jgi:hypothetical protein
MKITIDTTEELSATDLEILALLTGTNAVAPTAKPAAKKAAAAKPAPEPEPEADEDLVGGDAPTMADAVALATKLVSAGDAAKVKAALADAGAKRVSELPDDAIAGFVAALSD